MKRNTILKIMILTAAFILFLTGCKKETKSADDTVNSSKETETSSESTDETQIDALKSFTCHTIDGGTFTQDDFSGKDLTIMNFWMTTCQPCIREIPQLEQIKNTLPDNVQMVLVSLDDPLYLNDVKSIIEQTGFTGTVMMSGDQDMKELGKSLLYVPTTLFFDNQGNIVGPTMVGSPENLEETYTTAINDILKDLGKEAEWKK